MEEKDKQTLFDKYYHELTDDTKIDEFNPQNTQLELPGKKHKWVARLMQQKQELKKLNKLRAEAIRKIVEGLQDNQVVRVSDKTLALQAEEHELVKKIDEQVIGCLVIIELLEKEEKILAQMTYDMKNLIELRKMETT